MFVLLLAHLLNHFFKDGEFMKMNNEPNNYLIEDDDDFNARIKAYRAEIDETFAEMKRFDEQQRKYNQIIQILMIIFWIVVIIAIIKNWIL